METVLVMWDKGSGTCKTVFFGGHTASPAVFPSFVGRPLVVAALVVDNGSGTCYAGFAGCLFFALFPICRRQAQDALHHGRCGPEGQYSSCARRGLRQWHMQGWFFLVLHFALCTFLLSSGPRCLSSWPVWTRRNVTWRRWRQSAENCGFSAVAAHLQGRRFLRRSAVADFHGPACLDDHRDSPVAPQHGDRWS